MILYYCPRMLLRLGLMLVLLAAAVGPQRRLKRTLPPSSSCYRILDLQSFHFMNKICNDCFRLYRDPEIYTLCRYRMGFLVI